MRSCHPPGTGRVAVRRCSVCPFHMPGVSPCQGEKSVSVDGKCSDPALLSGLLEEVRATLAKC